MDKTRKPEVSNLLRKRENRKSANLKEHEMAFDSIANNLKIQEKKFAYSVASCSPFSYSKNHENIHLQPQIKKKCKAALFIVRLQKSPKSRSLGFID